MCKGDIYDKCGQLDNTNWWRQFAEGDESNQTPFTNSADTDAVGFKHGTC